MCSAAHNGNLPLVQLLAKHGVPIHPVEAGDSSPLHEAATGMGDLDCLATVRWLLDQGVPVDAKTEEGKTPLDAACVFYGDIAIIKLLLKRGADPADIARADPSDEEREKLRAAGVDVPSSRGKKMPSAKIRSRSRAVAKKKRSKAPSRKRR
jgi:ankyrin repeat protein